MSLLETGFVAVRDRKRLSEIATVAVRFGLEDILGRIGLEGLLPARSTKAESHAHSRSAPERTRLALESLGPAFIKLGQVLSTRGDLLPPEWISEFEKLQSDVPPQPWEMIRPQVEADLGSTVDTIFATFDRQPLAAGSIAQVHRATLHDGTQVIVKIRREGLRAVVDADLRLLSHAATLAEKQWPDIARYRPHDIVRHLGAAMADELDLATEARNSETIAANLAHLPYICIPRIHAQWTGERLLVQDYVTGIAPNDHAGLQTANVDGPLLARRGAQAFLHMALVDGMFHADPHPGNLRAMSDNRVAFLDFGMVGRLGGRRREQLLSLLGAIVNHNGARIADLFAEWSGSSNFDYAALESDCDNFVMRHGGKSLHLGKAVQEFVAMARNHQLSLPPDLALLFKALITADGVMRSLDPDFDVIAVAGPIVRKEMSQRIAPRKVADKGRTLTLELMELVGDLPGLLRLLAMRLRQGKLHAEIELKNIDKIGTDIRWAATRIAVAVVTAAFALGIAPTLITYGPTIFGVPLLLWLGLAVIIGGIAWLIVPRRR